MNKNKHTVGTFQKFNGKIAERDKIDTPKSQLHDISLSLLGTDTSIKGDSAKLVL